MSSAVGNTIWRRQGPLGSSLAEVRSGLPLSQEMACRLIQCNEGELPELLAAAVAAKERFKPKTITYSRKVFIPLTNLCRDYCGYCTFRRDPGEPGAHTMTPEEVLSVAKEGETPCLIISGNKLLGEGKCVN